MTIGGIDARRRRTAPASQPLGVLLAAGPLALALLWTIRRLPEISRLLEPGTHRPADPAEWIAPMIPLAALVLSIWWAACGLDELRRARNRTSDHPVRETADSGTRPEPHGILRKSFWLLLGLQALVSVGIPAHAEEDSASEATPLFDSAPPKDSADALIRGDDGADYGECGLRSGSPSLSTRSGFAPAARTRTLRDSSASDSVDSDRERRVSEPAVHEPGPGPSAEAVLRRNTAAKTGTKESSVEESSAALARSPLFEGADADNGSTEVVVLRGDTLWSIASERSPGASATEIMRIVHQIGQQNQEVLKHGPDRLLPGMILRIPTT